MFKRLQIKCFTIQQVHLTETLDWAKKTILNVHQNPFNDFII